MIVGTGYPTCVCQPPGDGTGFSDLSFLRLSFRMTFFTLGQICPAVSAVQFPPGHAADVVLGSRLSFTRRA